MPYTFKTIFVPASFVPPKKGYKAYTAKIDGVNFSTEINAAITEMEGEGYDFVQMDSVTSAEYYGRVFTEGMILLFKKKNAPD